MFPRATPPPLQTHSSSTVSVSLHFHREDSDLVRMSDVYLAGEWLISAAEQVTQLKLEFPNPSVKCVLRGDDQWLIQQ